MLTQRCQWCLNHPLYIRYHDEEWGRPCYDDQILFEFLILEGAQAGLSWLTVLKREKVTVRHFVSSMSIKLLALPVRILKCYYKIRVLFVTV